MIAVAKLIITIAQLAFSLSILMCSPPFYAFIIHVFGYIVKQELAIFFDFIEPFGIFAKQKRRLDLTMR